jgi:hypothetical protein
MNRPIKFTTLGVILLVCGLQLYSQPAEAATFTTFDPSGSVNTQPTGINPAGVITGYYQDASGINHGFLRTPDGTITEFDPPGYPNNTLFVNPGLNTLAIDPAGTITGSYVDANGFVHGFLRFHNGTFTTFDFPGPPGFPSVGTYPSAINSVSGQAATTGYYYDNGGTPHGFLLDQDTFTTFDPPGPLFYQQQIYPQAINPAGAITGYYEDASFLFHGFLRTPDGTFTTFDPTPSSVYTVANGINPVGAITGYYTENIYYGPYHAFLRAPNGIFTTVDLPSSSSNQGTFAFAIDQAGTITGNYFANNMYHGFLWYSNGTFTTFDPPGSTGTSPSAIISVSGGVTTTGSYSDAGGATHGFVRSPDQEVLEITISASPTQVEEGQNATFKISAQQKVSKPLTISYSMSGSAALGSDYTLNGSHNKVTIPAGQSSATVTLHSIEGSKDESKERIQTVTMTLSKGAGYTLKNNTATVTINP